MPSDEGGEADLELVANPWSNPVARGPALCAGDENGWVSGRSATWTGRSSATAWAAHPSIAPADTQAGWISSRWEEPDEQRDADALGRPRRRYYQGPGDGRAGFHQDVRWPTQGSRGGWGCAAAGC